MIVWGFVIGTGLVLIYTRPYQLATGAITESGPFVAVTGELVLALLFGGILSGGGVFAYWALRKFYA